MLILNWFGKQMENVQILCRLKGTTAEAFSVAFSVSGSEKVNNVANVDSMVALSIHFTVHSTGIFHFMHHL